MPTNIITLTNIITNTITNTISISNLKVAELPPKTGWEITLLALTALGALATMASAIVMACSVKKMGEQIKISKESVEEMKKQNQNNWLTIIINIGRDYRLACEQSYQVFSQSNVPPIEQMKYLSKRANILYEGCALYYNNFKSTPILKDTWNLLMQENIKQFIKERADFKKNNSAKWNNGLDQHGKEPIPLKDTGLGNYCKEYKIDTGNPNDAN